MTKPILRALNEGINPSTSCPKCAEKDDEIACLKRHVKEANVSHGKTLRLAGIASQEKDAEIARLKSIASQNANTAEFLLKERDELAAKLETAREAFLDIRDNYDCHCGAHSCQTCAAREALKQIGE